MAIELGATRWTSNTPRPFARAPGGGMGTVATPFGRLPAGGRLGGVFESGFAAEAVGPAASNVVMNPEKILVNSRLFTVKREPVTGNDVPALVARFRYTDRGTLTKEVLDAKVAGLMKKAGFKVSTVTSFKGVNVTWRWEKIGAEAAGDVPIYVPVVAAPAEYAGLRYAGSAFRQSLYAPDDKVLASMPNQLWIYTVAFTSAHDSMADGEAAQALTLLKQAVADMEGSESYGTILATLRGCPRELFGPVIGPVIPKPVKAGFSALLLLVAYNFITAHAGSEVL
jgi:hypothetical protein